MSWGSTVAVWFWGTKVMEFWLDTELNFTSMCYGVEISPLALHYHLHLALYVN